MLHENDVVRLRHSVPAQSSARWPDLPSTALDAGAIGTIVLVYRKDSLTHAYEVEFVDNDGSTLALLTLKEEDIELVE